jgi:hypothetical protein
MSVLDLDPTSLKKSTQATRVIELIFMAIVIEAS